MLLQNLGKNLFKCSRNYENLRKLLLVRTFTEEQRMSVNGHEVSFVKTGKEISDDNLILLPGALVRGNWISD